MKYSLAKNGIFRTVQGEGALLGVPMTFIRLAGCSIGCPLCDTDYKVNSKMTATQIARTAKGMSPFFSWVWITGGEPTDHKLGDLVRELHDYSLQVAVATAGHKPFDMNMPVSFLSVSPHDPSKWEQKWGTELKLVPGLNGFHLKDFNDKLQGCRFDHKYAQPCDGLPGTVEECFRWVESHEGWRMTVQAHKQWNMP